MSKLTPLLEKDEFIFWDSRLLRIDKITRSIDSIVYTMYEKGKFHTVVPEYAILWKFANVKRREGAKRIGRPSNKMRIKDFKME